MKHKLQLKNMALSIVLALAMVAGALPGVMQTGHAAMHYDVYVDDSISNGEVSTDKSETSGGGETVTLTVTPGDGYKLKKLSVIQPDVLSSISDLAALMGDAVFSLENEYFVKIDEGKFSVFHNDEKIASLDNSEDFTNNYGAGGHYTANTENSGYWSFYITGGKLRRIEFSKGNDNLTFHGIGAETISGTEIVTTTVTEGTKYTFAAPRSNVYVTAEFEMLNPKTVLIDVGKGHESLFTAEVLNDIKSEFELTAVTINGNIIKLEGVNPSTTEYDLWEGIDYFVHDLVKPVGYMHNKERFRVPAYRPIDEYATDDDLDNDINNETHRSTQVSDNLTYYLFWAKPYEKLEIDNGNPTCGNEWWKAFPTVPDGFIVDEEDSYWIDENGEVVEKFEGGKTYIFNGRIYHRPYGDLWKYFIDPDNFTLTVKDGKDINYKLNGNWINDLTFKATADHDWDAGKVTKEATESAEGVKTYTCTVCKATKTEAIPKLDPKPAPKPTPVKSTVKPVLVAKGIASGSKAVNISWNKIKDADRYEIYMSKCNYKGKKYTMKKVKTVNGGTLKWTRKGLAKQTSYKFYVRALKKSGKNYKVIAKSKTGHFFTGGFKGKYTDPKSLKLNKSAIKLKKGKSASIKGTVTKVIKSKKLATNHAAKLRFTSNNPSVATVNAKGKVTAKKAGTATIYVQTINGIWKTCKVTVN